MDTMTRSKSLHPLVFTPALRLETLGLDGASAAFATEIQPDGSGTLCLGEGHWASDSGGGIAVKTIFTLDEASRLQSLTTHYLCVHPLGRCLASRLFEITTSEVEKGLTLKSLTVLGRKVNLRQNDLMMRALGALQHIHADLRNQAFPEIAKTIQTFGLPSFIGENLLIPGLSPDGGFRFHAALKTDDFSEEGLLFPTLFFPESITPSKAGSY